MYFAVNVLLSWSLKAESKVQSTYLILGGGEGGKRAGS